jgi:hypothetical protein
MQVIDNEAVLDAIHGGGGSRSSGSDIQITCTISTKEAGCTGEIGEWGKLVSRGFKALQRAGGDFGCWVYDVTH